MLPGRYYHVFNRGNNGDNIFYQGRNYEYFLRRYLAFLSSVADTYCYCLLPNHFHLLIRVKEEFPIPKSFKPKVEEGNNTERESRWVSELFRRFFLSYAQAIIKQEDRELGSVFVKRFKRLEVDSDAYLTNLILYIHANAQLHGLCSDFRDYFHSSYSHFFTSLRTPIMRKEVLDLFGSLEAFEKAHLLRVNWDIVEPLMIEEDQLFLL